MTVPPEQQKKERNKAKELRQSQWWKQQLAKGQCHHCGEKFPKDMLSMDHLIPIARGGRSTKGNCVVSCKDCNSKKGYLTPVEQVLQKTGSSVAQS